jgi:hypothetical protein
MTGADAAAMSQAHFPAWQSTFQGGQSTCSQGLVGPHNDDCRATDAVRGHASMPRTV